MPSDASLQRMNERQINSLPSSEMAMFIADTTRMITRFAQGIATNDEITEVTRRVWGPGEPTRTVRTLRLLWDAELGWYRSNGHPSPNSMDSMDGQPEVADIGDAWLDD